MGPFMTAYVKVHDRSKESRAQAARWLAGFREHLEDGSLGQISELFDGNAPHRPRGCIAQAWSVAELLRAIIEDLIGLTPATPQVTAGQQANLTQRSTEKGEST
jgi:glycogen debranching enzyme